MIVIQTRPQRTAVLTGPRGEDPGWETKETLAQRGHPGGKDINLGPHGGREAELARATEVTLVV